MTPKLLIDNVRSDFEASRLARSTSVGGGDGGDHMNEMSERVRRVEQNVAKIEGSLDWAKLVASILIGVVLAGFSLLTALSLNVTSKVEAISGKISEEFRLQRQDTTGQISAISNAITAAKQQPPQVLLVPTPTPQKPDPKP